MKSKKTFAFLTTLVLLAGCATQPEYGSRAPRGAATDEPVGAEKKTADAQRRVEIESRLTKSELDRTIALWKSGPQQVAKLMLAEYGSPDEFTSERLIWHRTGPWKRIELVNQEIPHHFPMPHHDMLEQVINYQVPLDRLEEIARYDGSVIYERTKGELSARCDQEEMNFLALNLAHEIATGERTAEEARDFYARTAMAFKNGEVSPYAEGLLFEPTHTFAGDPDQPSRIIEAAGRSTNERSD